MNDVQHDALVESEIDLMVRQLEENGHEVIFGSNLCITIDKTHMDLADRRLMRAYLQGWTAGCTTDERS